MARTTSNPRVWRGWAVADDGGRLWWESVGSTKRGVADVLRPVILHFDVGYLFGMDDLREDDPNTEVGGPSLPEKPR